MTEPETDGRRAHREQVLWSLDAGTDQVRELLAYNRNVFNHGEAAEAMEFPLPDDPGVIAWRDYAAADAAERTAAAVLREVLVQLRFPIREGISQTEGYRAACLRGTSPALVPEVEDLPLERPDRLQLEIHPTPAGDVPIIVTGARADFESLTRALTHRNEPAPVPASMGAVIVSGYNNWDRIRRHKRAWEEAGPQLLFGETLEEAWKMEFQWLIDRKELYQDSFIVLSDGPYSGVAAGELGLAEEEWRRLSIVIRRDHECTHYFTRRLFGSARNNLFDEIVADYMGIVAALGHYREDWFLRFIGLEDFPHYRRGARLENYPGDPPLSAKAFKVLTVLVKRAAETLQRFDDEEGRNLRDLEGKARFLTTVTTLTLEELAADDGPALLREALRNAGEI